MGRRLAFMDELVLGIRTVPPDPVKDVTRRIGDRRPFEVGDIVDVCEALVPLSDGPEEPPLVGYRCDRAIAYDHAIEDGSYTVPWPWKVRVLPARYCPSWAVRTRVEVLDVRREILSAITDDDARREGVERLGLAPNAEAFLFAFRGIHRLAPDADPLVWRIEFRRVSP